MTREQQVEAARWIRGKIGPLGAEELATYNMLMRTPEQYRPPDPDSGDRVCGVCGEVFERIQAKGGNLEISALEQFSNHVTQHNPSPAQWLEAHRRIQSGREMSKQQGKE
jgi:hypothetical protein